MARLLADENFPLPVTEQLRALGHDVATLEELGKSDQRLSDEGVLELAIEQRRAVLTTRLKADPRPSPRCLEE